MDKNLKDGFPNTKAICDITLLFCALIRRRLENKKLQLSDSGRIRLSRAAFDQLVIKLKQESGVNWSKEYREMTAASLSDHLVSYMEDFKMLAQSDDQREIDILPLAGKLIGSYPEDAAEKMVKNDREK